MNLPSNPLAEDPTTSSSSVLQILRISKLQGYISQAKTRLAQLTRDTENARRRVKAQNALHRKTASEVYSQAEVSDLMTLVLLLEEENSQLRALSALPAEIEKLKSELLDVAKPDVRMIYENSLKDLQIANERLRNELNSVTAKLNSAEEKLQAMSQPVITIPCSKEIPEPLTIEVNTSERWAKPLSPASPASRNLSKPLIKGYTSPRRTGSKPPGKGKSRGYSPTSLRLSRKKLESSSPTRRPAEDAFADVFPEAVEGKVQVSRR